MAYPFMPVTDEMLKKLSQAIEDSNSPVKYCKPRFVLAIPNAKTIEESNSKKPETDHFNCSNQ